VILNEHRVLKTAPSTAHNQSSWPSVNPAPASKPSRDGPHIQFVR
jgi:hypothetical protein